MQTNITKKTLLLMLLAGWCITLSAQPASQLLVEADTLFGRKQYTQSIRLYEQILHQTGQATPAMLLRMAFVREGFGDYTQALYYLNLYYRQKPRQSVALKMEELASRHSLEGYRFSDVDFFFIWYDQYYEYLVAALLLLSGLMLITVTRKKVLGRFVLARHGIGLMLLLLLNIALLNLRFDARTAIVARENAYLMSAPSAGARLVHISRKGNRLPVSGRQDIWLKTEWNGQTAFVRQQHVLLVE
jgi:tetratricopeptide (TPR) repeat protein